MSRPTLIAALHYFGCVFGAGFVLGAIRVPLLVPRLGERWAELLEMPLMAAVIVFAARWVVRRHGLPSRTPVRLGMGLVALALLVAAESGLALLLPGGTIAEYIAGRDPVSGTVYALMLVVFALMPLFVGRRAPTEPVDHA